MSPQLQQGPPPIPNFPTDTWRGKNVVYASKCQYLASVDVSEDLGKAVRVVLRVLECQRTQSGRTAPELLPIVLESLTPGCKKSCGVLLRHGCNVFIIYNCKTICHGFKVLWNAISAKPLAVKSSEKQ